MLLAVSPAVGLTGAAYADDSEVTVEAPAGGSVTVEKTANLVNEVIHVGWEGFKPSVNPDGTLLFRDDMTRYPVRVYQCRGEDPAGPEDCYGSAIYDYPGRDNPIPSDFLGHPDGPFNRVDIATAPDGTAGVDIEVMTKRESVTLGCEEGVACSIVVVPNYGDDTREDSTYPDYPACATIYGPAAQCLMFEEGIYGNTIDAPWAWANRAVVPISFAPSAESCGLGDAEVALLGSPKAERALTSWQSATCTAATPVDFDYTSQGEDLSRNAFLNGLTDVALTVRPVDPAAINEETRPFVYAPIATSSVVVAFRVDDPATGLAIAEMRLNPRLIAKLVTQSYGYGSWSEEGSDLGNPATRGNPATMFSDPEFLELNPDVNWPENPNLCSTPLLLADRSDLTYELTRYVAADPDAAAFLGGTEDEWGMALNTTFAEMTPYPVDAFELRDPDDYLVHAFQLIQGLNAVSRKLVGNSFAGTTNIYDQQVPPKPEKCNNNKGYQPPGSRAFVAIIDSANAAAYRFPVADVLNAGGAYVGATGDAMAVAVSEMTVNEDSITRSPDFDSTKPDSYPLTIIDYAMVPTSGMDADKAEAIGRILDYAGGLGQQTGQLYGGLPLGFLPLESDLAAQTAAAAAAVRAQDGADPTPTPTPTPTSAPSVAPVPPGGGAAAAPGAPAAPGAAPVPGAIPPGPSAAAAGVTPTTAAASAGPFRPISAQTPAWIGVILPVVLVAGLVAAGVGALASWLLGRGGITTPRLPWRRGSGGRQAAGAAPTSRTRGPLSGSTGGAG